MRPDIGDVDLLAIQVATLFVLTESGRIQRENDPDRSAGPRLYLAGCESGNIVRIRQDVGEETARAINALVADEPPLRDPRNAPLRVDDYVELLSRQAPIEQRSAGPIYSFPDHLEYEHDVTLVGSNTAEGDRLVAGLEADQGMPQSLVDLGFVSVTDIWAPWCIALHQGEIASIGMTARIGPTGGEVGVTTSTAFRGRGFAAAVVAGWASHPSLRSRALFYSADWTNVSSQRVAERLGLRLIGGSLRLT